MALFTTKNLQFMNFLRYPDMEIEQGQATFISGPSGSGKSTLLKLFNGVAAPDGGEILYNGQSLASLDTIALRREVLLVSQAVYLFEGTIAENFAIFHDYRGQPAPDEQEMRRCLDLCEADFSTGAQAGTMSGGERQRVYIAIFLSFWPKVLMLDEPTSALDATHAGRLLQNLKQEADRRGATLLVVSHDGELVKNYADRVVRLEGGEKRE